MLPLIRAFDHPGDIFLPGVQKNATTTTTICLQEITNSPASVIVESYDAEGRILKSRPYTLAAFGSLRLPDEVAAGAASAAVRATSNRRVQAFAQVIDSATSDVFTVIQIIPSEEVLFVPVLGTNIPGVTIMIHLTNASDNVITVTAEGHGVNMGERRRAASHSAVESLGEPRTITIPPHGTRQLRVAGNGFVKLTGPASLRAAATYSVARNGGRIGSGVAAIPAGSALRVGRPVTGRFTGIEDSTTATVAAAQELTFRTNMVLVETTGTAAATVRLILRYTFPGGAPLYNGGYGRLFYVPAGGTLVVDDLARSIIGAEREAFGDLHNAYVDIDVLAGSGSVLPFLQVIDNGTGDFAIRHH